MDFDFWKFSQKVKYGKKATNKWGISSHANVPRLKGHSIFQSHRQVTKPKSKEKIKQL